MFVPCAGFIHVMENLEKYFCHGMSWKCHGILFFWKSHGNVMEFYKNVTEKVCFYKFHNKNKYFVYSLNNYREKNLVFYGIDLI